MISGPFIFMDEGMEDITPVPIPGIETGQVLEVVKRLSGVSVKYMSWNAYLSRKAFCSAWHRLLEQMHCEHTA